MFDKEKSVLVVIDVQGKLAELVHDRDKTYQNIRGLIETAKILGIPILWTEQVPEKIGVTIPEITQALPGLNPITKISFSCCGEKLFLKSLRQLKKRQIVLTGIETHVCVYQTALDLLKKKYSVSVIADCVSSRSIQQTLIALEHIKTLGGNIITLEMLACAWLKRAEGEAFKGVLRLLKNTTSLNR